ncbi:MAG: hypothetical protein WCA08_21025, partial [Desulfoferrobacter sp.]
TARDENLSPSMCGLPAGVGNLRGVNEAEQAGPQQSEARLYEEPTTPLPPHSAPVTEGRGSIRMAFDKASSMVN